MCDSWVGSREKYWVKTQFTLKKKVGENSDIGLMKTKNKGSGKVYKMVGWMTGLTEPYVVSIICI